MINSLDKLYEYWERDRIALSRKKSKFPFFVSLLTFDSIWRFQILLRTSEYLKNTQNRNLFSKIFYLPVKFLFRRLSLKLNFTIPENVFGPGLAIMHYGTIVINSETRVGENCRIHVCTNIGQSGGKYGSPLIGNNVYIGPGVKIYGKINIPNNVAIAANAAVGKSFYEEGVVIGGVPAKIIGKIDISTIIKHID